MRNNYFGNERVSDSPPSISVIVPVLNDAANLDRLCGVLVGYPAVVEVIVADGGSTDELERVAASWGAKVLPCERGRGVQLNRGAAAAREEILWFLHADVLPPDNADDLILRALADSGTIGGAFRFRLLERRWFGGILGFFINLRSRVFRLPYGDQGYFVRRSVFDKVGGFPNTAIMEDVGFMDRIRGMGGFILLNASIGVSSRRWDREGVFRATLRNWRVFVRFRLGASVEALTGDYPPETMPNPRDPSTRP